MLLVAIVSFWRSQDLPISHSDACHCPFFLDFFQTLNQNQRLCEFLDLDHLDHGESASRPPTASWKLVPCVAVPVAGDLPKKKKQCRGNQLE